MNNYYVYYYLRSKDSDSVPNGTAGTPYYIGKGKGRRIKERHRLPVPKDSNLRNVIANNLSESQAHQIEKVHIKIWGRFDLGTGILRNQTDGGEGNSGRVISDEARRKLKDRNLSLESRARQLECLKLGRQTYSQTRRQNISKAMKGRKLSDSHVKSLKRAWESRNRHVSDETRAKLAAASRGRIISDQTRAKFQSLRHTDESKAKISAANRGRTHSAETRAKISLAGVGREPPNKGTTVPKVICHKCARLVAQTRLSRHTCISN